MILFTKDNLNQVKLFTKDN